MQCQQLQLLVTSSVRQRLVLPGLTMNIGTQLSTHQLTSPAIGQSSAACKCTCPDQRAKLVLLR